MKVAAIIAEYNPFHNGHKYHIEETRRITKADYIIAIISGNFTQRGEPAIIDKYARAKMALDNGVDLCLELPIPYSTASAEYFAYGAISILSKLGVVDYLCFGSECNDLELLKYIALFLTKPSDEYNQYLNEYIQKGNSFPKSRELALFDYFKSINSPYTNKMKDIISSPNNILGIEYLKALIKLDSNIEPITIARKDNGYNNTNLSPDSNLTSASSIRINSKDNLSTIKKYVPSNVYSCLKEEYNKSFPITYNDFSGLAVYNLITQTSEELMHYVDVDEVIANKLKNSAQNNTASEDILLNSKSKNITYSRLCRSLLHIILKETTKDFNSYIKNQPEYVRILGFKNSSSSLIKKMKKISSINLINKLTIGKKELSTIGKNMLEYDIVTSDIYNRIVSLKYNRVIPNEYTRKIIIKE